MNNKILEYHNYLTNIYNKAEKLLKILIELSYEATLNSYNNHYININGKYICQKYYMPVITIKDKGDICFNMDTIDLEFYITKEKLQNNTNLDKLINKYAKELNIYEFEDCTIDIYVSGNDKEEVLKKINDSKDSKFGVSINCSDFLIDEIINHFNIVYSLLFIK